LSEKLKDQELAKFYRNLMVSEANHYTMFLNFARQYGGRETVDPKWDALLEYEAEIMKNLGNKSEVHG
jgi:tRNA-(ms[2]io[6]A)-hydroxylase